ncbi:MAG: hypothetical protein KatS3mg125_0223 [Lysobacterales bacterium]|nr:MAG: hypothetical protein KatS3mg125_0223 [Xanthomonadales bacterium]
MSKGSRPQSAEDRVSPLSWGAVALAWGLPAILLGLWIGPPSVPLLMAVAALLFGLFGALAERLAPVRAASSWTLAFLAAALAAAWTSLQSPSLSSPLFALLGLPLLFGIFRARTLLQASLVPLILVLPPLALQLAAGSFAVEARDGALLVGAAVLALALRQERQRMLELARTLEAELMQRSALDALTGVLQRSAFESRAPEVLWLCDLRDAPLSLLRLDLDRLKRLNEKLGYAAGDTLIQQLGELIRRQLRQGDLLARLGGGGFVALLPGASLDAALRVAERIRRECERLSEPAGCTLSAGVAQRHRDESLADLIARADGALERAKRLGRNRVEVSNLEARA